MILALMEGSRKTQTFCLPLTQPYGIFHVRSPVGGRANFPYGRYD